jgi:hypothetical protein
MDLSTLDHHIYNSPHNEFYSPHNDGEAVTFFREK